MPYFCAHVGILAHRKEDPGHDIVQQYHAQAISKV